MIYFAYKNRNNYDRLMFVLAAEDFNQAYRRMKYFQQYTKYRQKQAEKIVVAQKNIEYETEQLAERRNDKIKLLSNKERERANLSAERVKESSEINRLKQKESELRKKIEEKRNAMEQIKKAIANLIAREAKENKTFKSLTANEELISQGFKNAKGKLKWPIENGIVIREFGPYVPAGLKGVKMHSDGVEISTTKDSKVKTIYEGEVKTVMAIPGANMAVIVRHGHYLTLYSNIVNVRVKPGDRIYEGHYIGDVYVDEAERSATLHLGIYEETQVLNPKNWLSEM
jgi:septal ring factor EnvC (AmiA/AmiB activator)